MLSGRVRGRWSSEGCKARGRPEEAIKGRQLAVDTHMREEARGAELLYMFMYVDPTPDR